MTATSTARALIAEDEPLLAAALARELTAAWPGLAIVASVGDGLAAEHTALALRPDVLFLDIRMPGQSGLETAAALADAWPADGPPFPLLVFVTAYDQYAVQAFEAQALDYVLKPVQPARLRKTVQKLQQTLASQALTAINLDSTLSQLRALLAARQQAHGRASAATPLSVIQAGSGSQIELVPLAEVVYFEAADKYVRVVTAAREYLIRTPLKELAARLDAGEFWQIHRGTLVRAARIARAERDAAGRTYLHLHGRPERLAVSRLHASLFKAM